MLVVVVETGRGSFACLRFWKLAKEKCPGMFVCLIGLLRYRVACAVGFWQMSQELSVPPFFLASVAFQRGRTSELLFQFALLCHRRTSLKTSSRCFRFPATEADRQALALASFLVHLVLPRE